MVHRELLPVSFVFRQSAKQFASPASRRVKVCDHREQSLKPAPSAVVKVVVSRRVEVVEPLGDGQGRAKGGGGNGTLIILKLEKS